MMRVLRIAGVVLLTLMLLAVLAVLGVTNTDRGRRFVHRTALKALQSSVHGRVKLGALSGNLLSGATLDGLSITDSAGAPFLSVQRATVRWNVAALVHKRIVLDPVTLDRPVVMLVRSADKIWNYQRIFPTDSTAPKKAPGFGSWITLDNLSLEDGDILVRSAWAPADSLSPARRDSAIKVAVGPESRLNIERVDSGFVQTTRLQRITGRLSHVRLADPDSTPRVFQVASLRMVAEPFRPPALDVRDVRGTFVLDSTALRFNDIFALLPATRATLSGDYVLTPGDIDLSLVADTLALADVRWIYPRLPPEGGGTLALKMRTRTGKPSLYQVPRIRVRIQDGELAGRLNVMMGPAVTRLIDTDLRFSDIGTRLLERLVAGLHVPVQGALTGRAVLDGTPADMRMNVDLSFRQPSGATSRMVAVGAAGSSRGAFTARSLRLEFRPLRMALVRATRPSLPVGGRVDGVIDLDGSSKSQLNVSADIAHQDGTERSHIVGSGWASMGSARALNVDAQFTPLSLSTVGRFLPAAKLQGTATGNLGVHGTLRDMQLDGLLRTPDSGSLALMARVDAESKEKSYDVGAALALFNARAVSARAPTTSLSAKATVHGHGTQLATMQAELAADVTRSSFDSLKFDSLHVRARAANGLLTLDSTFLRAATAELALKGSFGLAPGHEGTLSYAARIDSLNVFRRWLPTDTGAVQPSPARAARALERARADSVRQSEANEVARQATGVEPPPIRMDTLSPVRRDSVSGALAVSGTMRGSVASVDVDGRLRAKAVVVKGNQVRSARVEFSAAGLRTPAAALKVDISMDSVQAVGFAFDSIQARANYKKPEGSLDLAIYQDTGLDYHLGADVTLRLEQNEIRLRNAAARFDTTVWRAVGPSVATWGKGGVEVRKLELRNTGAGRIYVDGKLPSSGGLDFQAQIVDLQIANITQLLQGNYPGTGLFGLDLRMSGTRAAPVIRTTMSLEQSSFRGSSLPDVRAQANYDNRRLDGWAELVRERERELLGLQLVDIGAAFSDGGQSSVIHGIERAQELFAARQHNPMAVVTASLPVDLALAGHTGNRLLEAPMRLDLQADSLELDALPSFTDAVADVRGRLVGTLGIRGTPQHPQATGSIALSLASFRMVALGVTMRDIGGSLHILNDTVRIDSLVGRSDGRFAINGTIGIGTPSQAAFDLALKAHNAKVIDNEIGDLHASADITVKGPMTGIEVAGRAAITSGQIFIPPPERRDLISIDNPTASRVLDTTVAANRQLLPTQNSAMRNLKVNLQLRINPDTWARSHEANVELYTTDPLTVHVDNRRSAIIIDGTVNTDRGQYTYLGHRFVISSGSATFTGSPTPDPLLQLSADYSVNLPGQQPLTITLGIEGTAQQPKVTVRSNSQPPLSQTDLLSYLAFGNSAASLMQQGGSSVSGQSSSGGPLAGQVAASATRQLASTALGVLADEAQTSLGKSLSADVFDIRPAEIPSEITFSGVGGVLRATEFEFGKYLNRNDFVAVQARPADAIPGLRFSRRTRRGFRLDTSFESRYLLREPTLSAQQQPLSTSVFGMFLAQEWRF